MPTTSDILSKIRFLRDCSRLTLRASLAVVRSRRAANGGEKVALLTLPRRPHPKSVIFTVSARAGVSTTRRPTNPNVVAGIFWIDATYRRPPSELQGLDVRVLNLRCTDISKSRVSAAFAAAFDRTLAVDPNTFSGQAIEKSEINAAHIGAEVSCPRQAQEGFAYQRVIDNHIDDLVEDIRVAYLDGTFPVAYLKRRPLNDRFSNTNSAAELVAPTDVLSAEELQKVSAMALDLGIDYGEFDCLRDRNDGLIYVVDANATPWGPPNHLPARESEEALRLMTNAFRRWINSRSA